MSRVNRSELVDQDRVTVLHLTQRCVRGAYLCGDDRATGQRYEHRRGWIRDRLEMLAGCFGIDVLTYAVLSNHLHVVVRTRPDIVSSWSDEEVARRWLEIYPGPRPKKAEDVEALRRHRIATLVADRERLAEVRQRLSSVSWLMRALAEPIARRANKEEKTQGRFWQGRFGAQVLLDEAALLACAVYVDLNPVRAAMATTPETSLYTGVRDRIDDARSAAGRQRLSLRDWERDRTSRRSGWLSPVEIDEHADPAGPHPSGTGRRSSDKGFLPITLKQYLSLVDWTGRQVRADRRGAIPSHLAPILKRTGLDETTWCNMVLQFSKFFRRAAGMPNHLRAEARRRGQRWMQCPGHAFFTTTT